MIFVSSSCIKAKYISESVQQLVDVGFRNIELSGGTSPYDNMVSDLLELKEKFGLNYLLHNYFPPPVTPFVINLAALDEATAQSTTNHLQNCLALSRELKAEKFGFHTGFLINIPAHEVGKEIKQQKLFDKAESMRAFCSRFNELKLWAGKIELYLENNVLTATNYKNFENKNPFFFVDMDSYHELAEHIKFKSLIDIAHLKVSCRTLNLDFGKQLGLFMGNSDYIHISDNDGFTDANQPLAKNSELYELLSRNSLKNKTITLEVYTGADDIISSYENVEELRK